MKIPFKIGDVFVYIFIALLVMGSFASLYFMSRNVSQMRVVVEVEGKEVKSYPLQDNDEPINIRVDAGEDKYNVIIIKNNEVYVKEANCKDQVCVNWGKIKRQGETIVCLPHKLIVKIVGSSDNQPIDDIAS